jgi:uncharacterized repeat protein (TIGR03803 family)
VKHPSILVVSAALLFGSLAPPAPAATILHNFTGGPGDGWGPQGSLTLSGSKLYGMTYLGGTSGGSSSTGAGTIFGINTDGTGYLVLHNFTQSDGFPHGTLTVSGSKLYGMSSGGSTGTLGMVFGMNTNGSGFAVLHQFTGSSDGASPAGSLTLFGSKLYGMTTQGGSADGLGTIFSVNTDGTGYNVLHRFLNGANDGVTPTGALTLSGSKLYGMTDHSGSGGAGTIFSMNTDGSGFTLLHSFAGGSDDGAYPQGSLTLVGSKLYGLTATGGPGVFSNGTLFSINTNGTGFNLLHLFAGGPSDGMDPQGSLTLFGSTLYGMTEYGGSGHSLGGAGNGTIFRINTDGSGYNVLESFAGQPTDGANPYGDPTISTDGSKLYGMTYGGGTANKGVVFSVAITPAVPEPGACALLGLSLSALLGFSRSRRPCLA